MNTHKIKLLVCNVVIPLLLVLFWFVASLLLNNKYSFTALVYPHSSKQLAQYPKNKLLKGEKIKGEFVAKDDYLGMITIGFKDYVKHDYNEEDLINFRIKEKGSQDWYYSSDYKSGAIEDQFPFPFGFPLIGDSKQKTYQFEITSLSGNENNAVELNTLNPQFTAVHKFAKSDILINSNRVIRFMIKKIATSFTNIDFLLNSALYLLPLFIYVFIYEMRKMVSQMMVRLPIFILLFVCIDIFIIREVYIGILLLFIIGWFISIRQYHLDSKSSYMLAFIFLAIWLPLMYFNTKYIQNKLNIWVYFFLFTGTIQAIIEEKYPKSKRTNIIDIF